MAEQQTNAEALKFAPSALLELFELDMRNLGGTVLYFHPGMNEVYEPLVFKGVTYSPFPIEVTDIDMDGKKSGLPRPKVKASNANGFMSAFLLSQNDLIGAKFIRRRVFARFIDAVNFAGGVNPYGTPTPSAAYEDEVFYVNRKISENSQYIEFECVSPLELDNVKLPRRQMLGIICPSKFRDPETCQYSGPPLTDRYGKYFGVGGYGMTLTDAGVWNDVTTYNVGNYVLISSVADFTFGDTLAFVCRTNGTVGNSNNPQFVSTHWIADGCLHNFNGCKQHYPSGVMPFGGFLGINVNPYFTR